MITRTCTTTEVLAKVYNEEADSIIEQSITLIGKVELADAKKVLMKKGYNVLKVVSANSDTKLRAMSEEDYIKYSHIIPDRKKPEDK